MDNVDKLELAFSPDQLTLLNICLAFLMFGVALELDLSDFKRVFGHPRKVIVGLTSQLLLLPAFTVLLAYYLPIAPSMALGMVLIAACPGGNVSNFAVHIADGNRALSVTLTTIVTLAAVVVTPVSFELWSSLLPDTAALRADIEVPLSQMLKTISLLIALPLAVGMAVRYYFSRIADKIRKPVNIISLLLFLIIVVVAFVKNYDNFITYIDDVFWVVLIHNGVALLLGYNLARLARLDKDDRRTIAIETGIQNSGLGLILIFNIFGGLGGMALVAGWWGIWHLIMGMSLSLWWGKHKQRA